MGLKVTNNAFGTLNAGITNSDTTLVLQSGQGSRFPSLSSGDYFYATLIDTSNNLEIVKVTARSTDTMTIVRAQDNTTARTYSTNDRFELRPTAALLNEVITKADTAQATADAALPKAGGTMTGPLIINTGGNDQFRLTDGTQNLYMDTDSNGVAIAGGPGQTLGGLYLHNTNGSVSLFSGNNLRLTVDSSGRVTMPYQPTVICGAGSASRSAGTYQHWGTSGYVWTNIGSHWNASTGRFTAPVAGRYLVRAALRFSSETSTSYNYIQFNNSNTAQSGQPIRLWTPDGGSYRPHELSYILYLNANDWVEPRVYLNASATFDGGNVGQTDDGLQIIYLG